MAHILFITGKLAEPALRRTLLELAPQLGFDFSVTVLPITVVSLATTPWIARHLPALPQGPRTPVDAEAVALAERLDLLAARRAAERDDEALELTRSTRLLSVLHAGYVNESDRGEPRKDGYEVEIELPLFDWGDAKLARAEAMQRLSRARLAGTEAAAVSEVREQLALYRSSFDLARHYQDEVVPLLASDIPRRRDPFRVKTLPGSSVALGEMPAMAGRQAGSPSCCWYTSAVATG